MFSASWPSSCKQLIFTLRLSKAGAAERRVTINGAICRVDKPPSDDEEEAAETEPEEEEEVTPTAVAESVMGGKRGVIAHTFFDSLRVLSRAQLY